MGLVEMTALAPELETSPTDGDGPDIYHLICCNTRIAICGIELDNMIERAQPGDQGCLVCEDIDFGWRAKGSTYCECEKSPGGTNG